MLVWILIVFIVFYLIKYGFFHLSNYNKLSLFLILFMIRTDYFIFHKYYLDLNDTRLFLDLVICILNNFFLPLMYYLIFIIIILNRNRQIRNLDYSILLCDSLLKLNYVLIIILIYYLYYNMLYNYCCLFE
jgi:hypothetical protein